LTQNPGPRSHAAQRAGRDIWRQRPRIPPLTALAELTPWLVCRAGEDHWPLPLLAHDADLRRQQTQARTGRYRAPLPFCAARATPKLSPTCSFTWWQVLGSNQRRLSRADGFTDLAPQRPDQRQHALSPELRVYLPCARKRGRNPTSCLAPTRQQTRLTCTLKPATAHPKKHPRSTVAAWQPATVIRRRRIHIARRGRPTRLGALQKPVRLSGSLAI